MVWDSIMRKLRLSSRGVARSLLSTFEDYKPLTAEEAVRVRIALENSGVPEAASRLNATWSKILLKVVAS